MSNLDEILHASPCSDAEGPLSSHGHGGASPLNSPHFSPVAFNAFIDFDEEYEILQRIGEGCFARLFLVEHRKTGAEVVLKVVHKSTTHAADFFREFHYAYYLSPHQNILNTYDVAFQAKDCMFFAQELAPFGDLTSHVTEHGIGELSSKRVISQVASALDFMHSKELVHRDIKLDNILVFSGDFSMVKLTDFGSTRRAGQLLRKKDDFWLPYSPPELCDILLNEGFYVETASDAWSLGIVLFVCLTGEVPWQKADIRDPRFGQEFVPWQKRKSTRVPKKFSNFSPRLLRLLRRLLEPKSEMRAPVTEVDKYLKDKWLLRAPVVTPTKESGPTGADEAESLQYTLQSCTTEKKLLLKTFRSYGIETTVDREAKKQWLQEWLASAAVVQSEDDSPCRAGACRCSPPRREMSMSPA
ncbi:unnamed protein product [Cyprideis torosa]|uniref:Uncharacterized protein n=1 Tax=Cyprideis torosa TaxID=163714 RepID=A0A7R8WIE0_9CRUS|nr:unnamed protein product [Cyprideis torosa]CAG0900643.1 unnamed protein product [Cyprideis torosa]